MSGGLRAVKLANGCLCRTLTLMHHELAEVYRPAITKNKDKLVELIREKAEQASKSELAKKMKVLKGFYTLEMAPPASVDDLKRLVKDIMLGEQFLRSGAFKAITVKQALLLLLVTLEIFLWFFIGETIGKWHLVGYKV